MRWKPLLLALAALLSLGGQPTDSFSTDATVGTVTSDVTASAVGAARPDGTVEPTVPPAPAPSPAPPDAAPTSTAFTFIPSLPLPTFPPHAAVAAQQPIAVVPSPDPSTTPTPRATPKPRSKPDPTPQPKPKPVYAGKSHFWYPALGIDARWRWYGCQYGDNPDGPGPGVYRYACVPDSNIYMLGHAWSTFRAIMRGWHSGAMQVGQTVWYASPQGKVTRWKVKWIRHVTDAYLESSYWKWATNASPTPIMTLQTCDGRRSQYRIIVRLVPAS